MEEGSSAMHRTRSSTKNNVKKIAEVFDNPPWHTARSPANNSGHDLQVEEYEGARHTERITRDAHDTDACPIVPKRRPRRLPEDKALKPTGEPSSNHSATGHGEQMSPASTDEVDQELQYQCLETSRLSDEHSKCEDGIRALQKQIRSLEREKRKAQAEANAEAELVEQLNGEIEQLNERLRRAKTRELELRGLLETSTAQEQKLRSQLRSITEKLLQAAEQTEDRYDRAQERLRLAKSRQQEARTQVPTSSRPPPSFGSFGPADGPSA